MYFVLSPRGFTYGGEYSHASIAYFLSCNLVKKTTAGIPMFLVKVQAHQGGPLNEEADIQADKAISGKDVPTEWHDRTNRAVFT